MYNPHRKKREECSKSYEDWIALGEALQPLEPIEYAGAMLSLTDSHDCMAALNTEGNGFDDLPNKQQLKMCVWAYENQDSVKQYVDEYKHGEYAKSTIKCAYQHYHN